MASTLITTTARGSFAAMRFQGILVTDSYAQLASILGKALSREHVLFFAEPVHEASGAATDWYTEAEGPVVPYAQLSGEARDRAAAKIAAIATAVHALAGQLLSGGEASKHIGGNVLELALRYPGPEHIFLVDEQPVLTNWGFAPGSTGAQPEELMRLGLARPAPSAPPADAAAAEAQAAPQAAAAVEAQAAPTAGPFPWWRPLLAFLLGLLLLLALVFLAGLLFGPSGCVAPGLSPEFPPGCAQGTAPAVPEEPRADNALIALMTAEQEKERTLRRQLDDLRSRLAERAAQCVRTPEPPAPPEEPKPPVEPEPPLPQPLEEEKAPEEPPSLADLMPTTPDPPPAPEPKKEPKPTPKPVEKPKKQARGEDLRIPESAKKDNDVSFLEGCWDSDSGLVALNTGEPINVQYCFDANGRGTRTVAKPKSNDRCVGPVRARFDALGNLHIEADSASCRKGGGFVPQQVECTQGAGRATCYGQEKGGKKNKWDARFRRQ